MKIALDAIEVKSCELDLSEAKKIIIGIKSKHISFPVQKTGELNEWNVLLRKHFFSKQQDSFKRSLKPQKYFSLVAPIFLGICMNV